ncbi:RNA polymerase sigma factor RpoH [Candidatus Endoriftia persephone]|jgi:RNA polymerase sigma-32 factor|uniref:RNA polymerase sigma factor RpoH n=3 Tax=Gammaproteobacteria TaxID=1236 RepID=G2FB02_9GAMM|nr:RNA polymerase sigma factor RpoH [Candidatus Endoriftia persephone]EGV52813.1 RNA polymerase sigma-32 factor [endosymbiont of Riftia pachyptila (vent Ph05)]EGW55940.1 RNA polymerase sigma-32 factor [endosymbiont of Tevnia jerichonana (vent Tica)]USF88074.1 RNA polymerase sigma factor RpoH [Candidatus Endoriftia persephone]
MTKELTIPIALPTGSFDAYVGAAYQLPMLSAEEERSLALQLRDQQDLQAARMLVMSHIRFVIRIARGYSGYGLALPDLVQEGTVGLMKAVKRFDPDVGVRLVSFAVHWIKAEIHEFILRNWRIVKVATTKAQRKLFFNLRSSKKRLGWFSREEVEGVAEDLGVKPETVLQMEARLAARDLAFDGPNSDDEDAPATPAGFLPDHSMEPSAQLESADSAAHLQEQLGTALESLDERSREILQARWLSEKKATLHELAKRFGVSAERIRQIEKAAMKKLKGQIAA